MNWSYIITGYLAVIVAIILLGEIAYRRRRRLRRCAWQEACGPSSTWQPIVGQVTTLYRTSHSPDYVAEILRATVEKYLDVAQRFGCTVEVRELVIPQRRGPVEGRITFEVVSLPATE